MKKFILICCALFLTLLMFTSCNDVKPEFKFKLDLVGDVSDSINSVSGDFVVSVTNELDNDFSAVYVNNDSVISINENQGTQANEWLDNYIQSNVINEFPVSTNYYVSVNGYVYESTSGITFSVDKIFTNKNYNNE